MAFTAASLQAIEAAIAKGSLTVQEGDVRITYRSMDELLRARQTILDETSATPRSTRRPFVTRIRGSRGL